ncbi:unnamed protein product [Diplocarpon coronariae]
MPMLETPPSWLESRFSGCSPAPSAAGSSASPARAGRGRSPPFYPVTASEVVDETGRITGVRASRLLACKTVA